MCVTNCQKTFGKVWLHMSNKFSREFLFNLEIQTSNIHNVLIIDELYSIYSKNVFTKLYLKWKCLWIGFCEIIPSRAELKMFTQWTSLILTLEFWTILTNYLSQVLQLNQKLQDWVSRCADLAHKASLIFITNQFSHEVLYNILLKSLLHIVF